MNKISAQFKTAPKYNAPPSRLNYTKVQQGTAPKALWLVAAPCVGSTWSSRMLTELLQWRTFWPAPKRVWRRPQDVVYTPKMDRCLDNIFFQHTHTMYNQNTVHFLECTGAKVIIQTRDIYDNVVSTVDHLQKLDTGLPNTWVTDSFKGLAFELAAWHVIRYVLPWNLAFYVSWEHARRNGINVHFMDYSDLLSNPTSALGRVLAFASESRSAEELAQAINAATDPSATRFNVGKEGRGRSLLNDEQREHIDVLLGGYQDGLASAAFSRILPHALPNTEPHITKPHDHRRHSSIKENDAKTKARARTGNKNRAAGRLRNVTPGAAHHQGGS